MNSEHAVQGARYKFNVFALASVFALVGGSSTIAPAAADPRPATWATRVAASPGLPNLYRVNASLYRSAQPTKEGFVFLGAQTSLANADRPIETVVSLRAFNDDAPLVPAASGLRLEQIRFKTWHPEDEDVVKFLRITTTPAMQPVLVHDMGELDSLHRRTGRQRHQGTGRETRALAIVA